MPADAHGDRNHVARGAAAADQRQSYRTSRRDARPRPRPGAASPNRRSGGQAVRRSGGQAVRRSGGQAVRRSGGQAKWTHKRAGLAPHLRRPARGVGETPVPRWVPYFFPILSLALAPGIARVFAAAPPLHLAMHWRLAWGGFDVARRTAGRHRAGAFPPLRPGRSTGGDDRHPAVLRRLAGRAELRRPRPERDHGRNRRSGLCGTAAGRLVRMGGRTPHPARGTRPPAHVTEKTRLHGLLSNHGDDDVSLLVPSLDVAVGLGHLR